MSDLNILLEKEEDMPLYATSGSAGADLKASIKEPVLISPGQSVTISTGIRLEIPEGFEVQIRSRSGLARKNNVVVLNSPGTIDSDYRGEIKVILFNHGSEAFEVLPGMRIAQMVLAPVCRASFKVKNLITDTDRGSGGFGSSGL